MCGEYKSQLPRPFPHLNLNECCREPGIRGMLLRPPNFARKLEQLTVLAQHPAGTSEIAKPVPPSPPSTPQSKRTEARTPWKVANTAHYDIRAGDLRLQPRTAPKNNAKAGRKAQARVDGLAGRTTSYRYSDVFECTSARCTSTKRMSRRTAQN